MDIESGWADWSPAERELFDSAMDKIPNAEGIGSDEWVQFLYHEAMWDFDLPGDMRANAYNAFAQYMEETYDIEWEDIFDWDAYRDAYSDV